MTAYEFTAQDKRTGDKVAVETADVGLDELVRGPIVTLLVGMGFASEQVMDAFEAVAEQSLRERAMAESQP